MPIKSGAGLVVFLFWDWEEITQQVIKAFNVQVLLMLTLHVGLYEEILQTCVSIMKKYLYVAMHFCQFLPIVIIEEEKTENMCFKLTI